MGNPNLTYEKHPAAAIISGRNLAHNRSDC